MILKKRTGKIKQFPIATFDIEANNWIDFLIGGFYDSKNYFEFYSIKEFLKRILKREYLTYRIYAHFGGRYDFLFLLEELIKLKYKTQLIEVNGRILQLKIHVGKGYIYFIDSYSILDQSLEKLTKEFNVPVKKGKMDFSKTLKINNELKEYLKSDCIGLYQVIKKFEKEINLINGQLKITQASISLDYFCRNFLEIEIPTYPHLDKLIRTTYYGGRCEVFKKYGKNLYYYDYNSLYPSVMYQNFFPVGNPIIIDNFNRDLHFNNYCGFVEINVKIKSDIGILPYRQDKKLIFPNGKIYGYYALPYLKLLDDLKIKYETGKAILFTREKLFNNFVKSLYNKRLENKNNPAKKWIYKKLLNTLYGKFGQHPEKRNFIFSPNKNDFEKMELIPYSQNLDLWYEETNFYSNYILPAIASYVTSYSHIKLLKSLIKYSDHIYYCDTDSLVTDIKLPTSEKLGHLKLEDKIREGIFLAPKLYAYINNEGKEVIKAKGFKTKDLKYNFFKEALFENNTDNFYQENEKITGFKQSQILLINSDKNILFKNIQKKSIKNLQDKRLFINLKKSKPLNV